MVSGVIVLLIHRLLGLSPWMIPQMNVCMVIVFGVLFVWHDFRVNQICPQKPAISIQPDLGNQTMQMNVNLYHFFVRLEI